MASQALLFLAIQILLVPAALSFLWLVPTRGRTLTVLGVGLYVLSALGHAAFSGAQLVVHRMVVSDDAEAMRKAYAALDSSTESIVVSAPGLIGLVLGTLLLGIGVIRSRSLPWWIGAALIAFVVAEFALASATEYRSLIAGCLWAAAFWGTALHTWKQSKAAQLDASIAS